MGRATILAALGRSARRPPTPFPTPFHIRLAKGVAVRVLVAILRATLTRYGPRVVVVTGSAGKSTTTELIARALRTRYEVRATVDNHNSELGVATIALGIDWPSSAATELRGVARAIGLLVRRGRFPELLVLELGAARTGGLQRMTDALRPDIAVVTTVGSAHLETFGSRDAIADEKSRVVRCLRRGGVAVLNWDDDRVREMARLAPGRVVSYGASSDVDVAAGEVSLSIEGATGSVRLRGDGELPFRSPLLGRHQIGAVLAAVAVGRELGVAPQATLSAIEQASSLPGRLTARRGPNGLVVLDDSYNASLEGTLAALEVLAEFPPPRLAVLGELPNLGAAAAESYEAVGAVLGPWLDELVLVGPTAEPLADAARARGVPADRITHVADTTAAVRLLEGSRRSGTALVKGSGSGARFLLIERVVAALVGDPSLAGALRRHPAIYRNHGPG